MNKLAHTYEHITNYTLLVKEQDDKILFLRKLIRGSADKSYGIHVAQLAGLPPSVITRAREIQEKFEADDTLRSTTQDMTQQMRLGETR